MNQSNTEPFHFHTRQNLIYLTGRKAKNISELLSGIKELPLSSIYFHTHHYLAQFEFLIPEPPNDFAYWIKNIFEFPPTTIRRAKNNFGAAGGGYLRLLPYSFTRWAIRQVNETESQPAMVYFHPWELDPEQPRISAPLRSRIRHYTNLSTMQHKVARLLRDFRFSTISDVCAQLESYQTKNV